MTMASDSLRAWLREQIAQGLRRSHSASPFVLWCDPESAWRELLLAAGEGAPFMVWAEEVSSALKDYHFDDPAQALRAYELLLRQRRRQSRRQSNSGPHRDEARLRCDFPCHDFHSLSI